MRHVTPRARGFTAQRKWLMVLSCAAILAAGVITTAATAGSTKKAAAPSCTSTSTAKYNLIRSGTLTVGTIGAAQPWVYQNKSGTQWLGIEPDLIRYVAKQICINKVVFVEQEFSSLLANVAARKYDLGGAAIADTPAREQVVNFVRPYLSGTASFISKADTKFASLSDLAGKRVGVVTGSIEETIMKEKAPSAQVVEFPDANAEVQALVSGQIDSAFVDGGTDTTYLKQYPQLALDFRLRLPKKDFAGVALAISKKDTALLAALNRQMNKAINCGLVTQLVHKWFPGQEALWFVPGYNPKNKLNHC
jgi:polar amino acid transport system substrate-binding protein